MTISFKEESIKTSYFDKLSMTTHLLSKVMKSSNRDTNEENLLSDSDELEMAFDEAFLSLQNKDALYYFQIIRKISNSLELLDCTIVQTISINRLNVLNEAISAFGEDDNCIYISLWCISILSLVDAFRDYFFSKDFYVIALDAFCSENQNVSFNALKILSIMIELALKNEIEFDEEEFLENLEAAQYKSHDHEYYVISILRSIIEFSDFSVHFEKIMQILSEIPLEDAREENITEFGETIYSIIKHNFAFFNDIHYRYVITGPLLEQLNENTIETHELYFPIPVLKIIIFVINNLKHNDINKAILFARLVSYDKYLELIRKSIVEVSELALNVIAFFVENKSEDIFNFCLQNKIVDTVIKKFIDEAPFIKKKSGMNFFLTISRIIDDTGNLENLLFNYDIIEKCSFCLESDDIDLLNEYLTMIITFFNLSMELKAESSTQKIVDDIIQVDIIERSLQAIDILLEEKDLEDEAPQLIQQKINEIDEIIKYLDSSNIC